MTLGVLGGSGFIGSRVVSHCRSTGIPVACIRAPRIVAAGRSVPQSLEAWCRSDPDAFDRLCRALEPFDVIVNAAGLATPAAPGSASLFGANAVLPLVVARAARIAAVRRLVHVSTAAVQGRRDPLDESPRLSPLSPYAASKAEGERALVEEAGDGPPDVVIYRPTSVHAPGRALTRQLARTVRSLPLVPVAGSGDRPAPVALVENVAAGIVFAASMPDARPIVLHPWEGLTTRRLLELFGARRIVPLPLNLLGCALAAVARSTAWSARLTAHLRRVEVVLKGQSVRAEVLLPSGFSLPYGQDRWEALAGGEAATGDDVVDDVGSGVRRGV